jgi:hypothetical protein
MRVHYYEEAEREPLSEDRAFRAGFQLPYLSYWYGGLYAVVEGWQELGLADVEIDELLQSPHVDALRRYRNGTFHYQRAYFDDRFKDLIATSGTAGWVFRLRNAFSRWFLDTLAAIRRAEGQEG